MTNYKMPVFFISHGGGPWPYVPEMKAQFEKSAKWLSQLPNTLKQKPKAILSISGHWEESQFSVSSAIDPPMIYDYSGFPEHTYKIKYGAKGSPELAVQITNLLSKAGIDNKTDATHGFDHGTFVPLYLMYPNAEIPVVSMSIKKSYKPLDHLAAGRALETLRDDGVLIIGSGLSYHNMRGFGSTSSRGVSQQFGKWLAETVEESDISIRDKRLIEWEKAPAARQAHPREDHLLPLMLVAGAAGQERGRVAFVDHVMSVDMASYVFG